MAANVEQNTNPFELNRKLSANGPIGFIFAVYETLKRLKRPYYYTSTVPDWFAGNKEGGDEAFLAAYQEFLPEVELEKEFQQTPHTIIHRYRQYPYKRRYAGTNDAPTGARRQKTPSATIYTDRPFPGSDPIEPDYYEESTGTGLFQPALYSTGERAPLWSSKEDVPDIIRDYIDENTTCAVNVWSYDVFVDFIVLSPNMFLLEQIHKDIMMILRTFHDRSHTGASNLTGWFYQSVSEAPSDIRSQIDNNIAARTITWRLQQTEAYAFPADVLDRFSLEIHGKSYNT